MTIASSAETNAAAVDLSNQIRDLTEEEVAHYDEKGWVYAPNFVAPDLCEQVIDHYSKWSGLRWREWPEDPAEQAEFRAIVDKFAKRRPGISRRYSRIRFRPEPRYCPM